MNYNYNTYNLDNGPGTASMLIRPSALPIEYRGE